MFNKWFYFLKIPTHMLSVWLALSLCHTHTLTQTDFTNMHIVISLLNFLDAKIIFAYSLFLYYP